MKDDLKKAKQKKLFDTGPEKLKPYPHKAREVSRDLKAGVTTGHLRNPDHKQTGEEPVRSKTHSGGGMKAPGGMYAVGEKRGKSLKSHTPGSVYVYGGHWPVVKHHPEHKTLFLNTNEYGGQTKRMVNALKSELPSEFPDHKIVHIHHPEPEEAARVMKGSLKDKHEHLKVASEHHPNPIHKKNAKKDLKHVKKLILKKSEDYLKSLVKASKNVKEQRRAFMSGKRGMDTKTVHKESIDRLNRYLNRHGLTAHAGQPGEPARGMGRRGPNVVESTHGQGPHLQQLTHEAAHAQSTKVGQSISEHQKEIPLSGPKYQSRHSAWRESGLPHDPEHEAKFAEAGIRRRSGLPTFRDPDKPGPKTQGGKARSEAKEKQKMLDEGIHTFEPSTGKKVKSKKADALINLRAMGRKKEAESLMREKYKKEFKKALGDLSKKEKHPNESAFDHHVKHYASSDVDFVAHQHLNAALKHAKAMGMDDDHAHSVIHRLAEHYMGSPKRKFISHPDDELLSKSGLMGDTTTGAHIRVPVNHERSKDIEEFVDTVKETQGKVREYKRKRDLKKAKKALKESDLTKALEHIQRVCVDIEAYEDNCPSCGNGVYVLEKTKQHIAECNECGAMWGLIKENSPERMLKSFQGVSKEKMSKQYILKCLWDLYTTGQAEAWEINKFDQTGWLNKSLAQTLEERYNVPMPQGLSNELKKSLEEIDPIEKTWGGLSKSEIVDTMLDMIKNNEEIQTVDYLKLIKFDQTEDISPELLKAVMKKKGLDFTKLSKKQIEDQDCSVTPDVIFSNPASGDHFEDQPMQKAAPGVSPLVGFEMSDDEGGAPESEDYQSMDHERTESSKIQRAQKALKLAQKTLEALEDHEKEELMEQAMKKDSVKKSSEKPKHEVGDLVDHKEWKHLPEWRSGRIAEVLPDGGKMVKWPSKDHNHYHPSYELEHAGSGIKKSSEGSSWKEGDSVKHHRFPKTYGVGTVKGKRMNGVEVHWSEMGRKTHHPDSLKPHKDDMTKAKIQEKRTKTAIQRKRPASPAEKEATKKKPVKTVKKAIHPGQTGPTKPLLISKGKVTSSKDPGGVGSKKKNGSKLAKPSLPNTKDLKSPKPPTPPAGSDKVAKGKLKKEMVPTSDKPSSVARQTGSKVVDKPKTALPKEQQQAKLRSLHEHFAAQRPGLKRSEPQEMSLEKKEYVDSIFEEMKSLEKSRDPENQQLYKNLALEVTKVELMSDPEFEQHLEKARHQKSRSNKAYKRGKRIARDIATRRKKEGVIPKEPPADEM